MHHAPPLTYALPEMWGADGKDGDSSLRLKPEFSWAVHPTRPAAPERVFTGRLRRVCLKGVGAHDACPPEDGTHCACAPLQPMVSAGSPREGGSIAQRRCILLLPEDRALAPKKGKKMSPCKPPPPPRQQSTRSRAALQEGGSRYVVGAPCASSR